MSGWSGAGHVELEEEVGQKVRGWPGMGKIEAENRQKAELWNFINDMQNKNRLYLWTYDTPDNPDYCIVDTKQIGWSEILNAPERLLRIFQTCVMSVCSNFSIKSQVGTTFCCS